MLDPFLGIGHSALAAKECGIGSFIGFDIDGEYVNVARVAVETGLTTPGPGMLRSPQGRPKRKSIEEGLFESRELF